MRRLALLGLLAAGLALPAAACGGGEDDPGGEEAGVGLPADSASSAPGEEVEPGTAMSPAGRIRPAIAGFLTSTDRGLACGRVLTRRFLREEYGNRRACGAARAKAGVARSFRLTSIDVTGDSARVVAVPRGGPDDGVPLKLTLVLEDRVWLVDAVE